MNVSGMTFSYDPTKPANQRVQEIFVNGQPLDEDKIYTIAMTNFYAAGGDDYTMLVNLKFIGDYGTDAEIFINYLNQVGMSGIELGRITRLKEVPVPDEE